MASWGDEVQRTLGQLASKDDAVRESAAAMLVELVREPDSESDLRSHFARLLADPLPTVRAAACAGLRFSGPEPDILALLEPALGDAAAPVRREAAFTLAFFERPSLTPLLQRALRDADEQVAFEAAVGLAALHDAAGVEVLLAGVNDSVRRFAALGGLAQLGEPRGRAAAEQVLGKFFISSFERAQAAGLLARLGVESGREYLLSRIAKANADDRGLAMELCGSHRVLVAIPLLRQALHNRQDPCRGTAARSLGLLGEDPSGETLNAMASDVTEDFDVRCDAMEGLMFLGTIGARTALERLAAEGESPDVKMAAGDALAWLATSSQQQGALR